jgi:cation:H+ antiporter
VGQTPVSPLIALAGVIGGLALLVLGADRVIDAAAELAVYLGVSPFVIGVSIVAVGTSLPEMVTSVIGAAYGAGDLVVGNIIGSELAQITLAIGAVAAIAPIAARRRQTLIYGGAMLLAMVIMLLVLADGVITRGEAVLMLLAYAVFIRDLYGHTGGAEVVEATVEAPQRPREALPTIAIGVVAVAIGGHLFVTGAGTLAAVLGLTEGGIGLIAGVATTVPEILVAGMAARGGETGISVGTLLGSNITDPVFSLGIGAVVRPVVIADPAVVQLQGAYLLGVSVLVIGLLYTQDAIGRRLGVLIAALYLPVVWLT